MPFQSEVQRRWMYANHPEMAKRWQEHTPAGADLPSRVGKQKEARGFPVSGALGGAMLGAAGGGALGYTFPVVGAPKQSNPAMQSQADRLRSAKVMAMSGGLLGGALGLRHGLRSRPAADPFHYRSRGPEPFGGKNYRPPTNDPSDPFGGKDPFADFRKHWEESQRRWAESQKRWEEEFSRSRSNPFGGSSGGGRYRSPPPRRPRPMGPPAWMGDVTTKAEAKAKWREAALKNHPDRGGDAATMAQINNEWDLFRASPDFEKLAYAAFVDEMVKLADLAGIVLSQIARREVGPSVSQAIQDTEESIAEKWRKFTTPEDLGYRPEY